MRSWQCELPTHRSHCNTHTIRSFPSCPHRLQSAEESRSSEIKFNCTCKTLVEPMWDPEVKHCSYSLWSGTRSCTWNSVRQCVISYISASQVFFGHRKCIKRSLILKSKTSPIVVGSHRQRARLAPPSTLVGGRHVLCRNGFGFGVSVLLLVESRSPSECLHRFTSRFFLNLRSIAYNQGTEAFETHPQPFETTPLRTRRPIRKQSGRLMTNDFVNLEMHKTIYSSGASPNEEEIGQSDILHMEVIDPQAHQQRR